MATHGPQSDHAALASGRRSVQSTSTSHALLWRLISAALGSPASVAGVANHLCGTRRNRSPCAPERAHNRWPFVRRCAHRRSTCHFALASWDRDRGGGRHAWIDAQPSRKRDCTWSVGGPTRATRECESRPLQLHQCLEVTLLKGKRAISVAALAPASAVTACSSAAPARLCLLARRFDGRFARFEHGCELSLCVHGTLDLASVVGALLDRDACMLLVPCWRARTFLLRHRRRQQQCVGRSAALQGWPQNRALLHTVSPPGHGVLVGHVGTAARHSLPL